MCLCVKCVVRMCVDGLTAASAVMFGAGTMCVFMCASAIMFSAGLCVYACSVLCVCVCFSTSACDHIYGHT